MSKNSNIRILKSNILAVLRVLYVCKTWRMTKKDEAKLDTFFHKHLRRVVKIYWAKKVTNEELGLAPSMSRWCWIGHVLCLDQHALP